MPIIMSLPLTSSRKKRNFKALQLPLSPTDPKPTRNAPAPSAKRRNLVLDSARHVVGLGSAANVNNSALLTPESSTTQRRNLHRTLSNTLEKLEGSKLDGKKKLDGPLKQEDLENLAELGMGNGGSVMKVVHVPTGIIMAKKVVLMDAKPSVRKQILRELHITHSCNSRYIVSSFGAYILEPNICICMEYMDKGSFDGIYKRMGAIPIDMVGMVAANVLEGLVYLYDVHHIIHRDIKPSNILLNSEGEIKLCDFGVSGELINSIANTFVGTSVYMSPERIQGGQYSVESDIWSLGITLIELAHGRFPFYVDDEDDELSSKPNFDNLLGNPKHLESRDTLALPMSPASHRRSRRRSKAELSILELLQQIVREPAPRLTSSEKDEGKFPRAADEFVDACLIKEQKDRRPPADLLKYEWIEKTLTSGVDMKKWAESI
ncbi:dual specificity protein kinase FUZ7 [Gymnopus androsaceus JB14]|uniref:Dual specificity protein kinase FUZ7 n=1 Tax=Gymnopus androsaceus JB14 TaxID=1447944 RepID=A0A6A4HDB4_9AGAR|nr:dual specificity protein kinase FUZ7 [Gymnopus androsaceus JB14]